MMARRNRWWCVIIDHSSCKSLSWLLIIHYVNSSFIVNSKASQGCCVPTRQPGECCEWLPGKHVIEDKTSSPRIAHRWKNLCPGWSQGWETVSWRWHKTLETECRRIWGTSGNVSISIRILQLHRVIFWGVGSLNLQQLSSVLSALCPGMLAEEPVEINLRFFLYRLGRQMWVYFSGVSLAVVGFPISSSRWEQTWTNGISKVGKWLNCCFAFVVVTANKSFFFLFPPF